MRHSEHSHWRKLDNAAQIFPATSSKRDTRVFRFYCCLKEQVSGTVLQQALDVTMEKYPLFLSVMRKGLFWFYLEKSELKPTVLQESKSPCSTIYEPDKKKLLFEVSYYKNRINFEVFHVLTDGTGATQFLRELVKNYLRLAHPQANLPDSSLTDEQLTEADQENDSFAKYYSKDTPKVKGKKQKAYQIRGQKLEPGQMQITEAVLSVKEVLAKAREYKVSMTVFLTAVFLCAVHEEMSRYQERRPVTLMVPVNLRNFFPSQSMLNFFGWIEAGYQFQNGEQDFPAVLEHVKDYFEKELTKDRIAMRMNELVSLQKHPVLRMAPLELKNFCLQAGARLAARDLTAVFSNMSVVKMPEEYVPYIERFGVFTSTNKMELCMCSFQDDLVLGFTSRLENPNILRNILRILKEMGLGVDLPKPEFPPQGKPVRRAASFFQWLTFFSIAAAVVTGILNLIITPKNYWCLFVFGGILCTWLVTVMGYYKRHNLMKNCMWQLVIAWAACLVWDAATGWRGWSLDYVLPGAVVIVLGSMWAILWLQKLKMTEYLIYLLMASGLGLLPLLFWALGLVSVAYPSLICAGVCVLLLVGLLIFKHGEVMQELHKKLHM